MSTVPTPADALMNQDLAYRATTAMEAVYRCITHMQPLHAEPSPVIQGLLAGVALAATGATKKELDDWRSSVAATLDAGDPRWTTSHSLPPATLRTFDLDERLLRSARRANRLALTIESDARELAALLRWLTPAAQAADADHAAAGEDGESDVLWILGELTRPDLVRLAADHLAGVRPDPNTADCDEESREVIERSMLTIDLVLADRVGGA